MSKKKKEEMRTLQEQLSSPDVQAVVAEEVVPPINDNAGVTDENIVVKKKEYLTTIPGHMMGLMKRLRVIQVASPEEQAIRARDFKAIKEEIAVHLGYKDELLRRAATHAYADAVIATLSPELDAFMKALYGGDDLPGFLELGIITETDKKGMMPTIKVNARSFQVNGGQATKRADALKMAFSRACISEVAKIKAKAKTTQEELLAGKPGVVFIDVSDEFIGTPDTKEGKRFLGGGVLLVKSDGKVIRPIRFLGHFQKIMTEIYEANVFVPVVTLRFDHLSLPEISPEKFRLCRIFHSILRRGLAVEFARQKPTVPAAPAKIINP